MYSGNVLGRSSPKVVYVELIIPQVTPTISIAHAKVISIVPFLLIIVSRKLPSQLRAKPSAVACRCVRPSRRGLRRYRRLLGRPHTVRSVRREAQPEPGTPAPAGLSKVRGHILGAFCCDRGRSAQGPAFPGKFRVAAIALGHAQRLLSQWSLPLLSWPRIATIQGAGVAFPGAGNPPGALSQVRET